MSSQESVADGAPMNERERVVEYEVKMPRKEEIKLPDVDLEPVREFAEKALIVGIGMGVLLARGVASAIRSAAEAGAEEAEHPGSVAKVILDAVGRKKAPEAGETKRLRVMVLPIDGYDDLSGEEVIASLEGLAKEDLKTVREHEITSRGREDVIAAIDDLMGVE